MHNPDELMTNMIAHHDLWAAELADMDFAEAKFHKAAAAELRALAAQSATPPRVGDALTAPEGWEFTKGGGVTEVFDIAQWDDEGGIWRDDETGLPVLHGEGELEGWPSGKINAVIVQVNRIALPNTQEPQ